MVRRAARVARGTGAEAVKAKAGGERTYARTAERWAGWRRRRGRGAPLTSAWGGASLA